MTTPKSALGRYEWLSIVGAIAYLTLPLAVVFPQIFETLGQVPKLEGERLAGFRSLMTVVTPIAFIYLFAVWRRATSLIDLTIVWRLLWVGPWLIITLATGGIELGGALVVSGLDLGLPIAALILDPRSRQMIPRLKAHFSAPVVTLAQRIMHYEARVGFVASFAVAIYLLTQPERGYVQSFVVSVVSLYYVHLAWAAKQDGAPTVVFSVLSRATLLIALVLCGSYGFHPGASVGFATLAGFGIFLHGYSALWERQTQGAAPLWTATRWMVLSALAVMLLSVIWAAAAPWYSQTCTQLAVNIHRQDLIIGIFAVLVGLLLVDVKEKAPLHTKIVSWLLPAAALWFTLETKLLCNLDVGSPFHPSWHARGLAPVYANVVAVDLTFSLATIFMTAIGTNYVAFVLLRFLPRGGWRLLAWHGILVIALSAFWMIAASSGVPAPVSGLPAAATVPPLIPVDPIAAVAIHIRDLLIGICLIAAGLSLDRLVPEAARFAKWTAVGVWVLFLMPKLYLHLHL